MRVIIFIRHFQPAVGGAEIQALRLAHALQDQGCQVTILTGHYGKQPRDESINGVTVRRLFTGPYLPVVHELTLLVSLAMWLLRHHREYDLIQLFQLQLSTVVAVVIGGQLLSKPVVTRSSGTKGSGVEAKWKVVPAHRFLLGYISRRIDAVVVLSSEMWIELGRVGFPHSILELIPNGVSPSNFQQRDARVRETIGIRRSDLVLVSVGRLTQLKQHDLLIKAIAALTHEERADNLCLVLIGDGEEKSALQGLAHEMGVADNVHFTGVVANVADYLIEADIFALPSSYEGMSNAMLEAMAAGLPVVASRTSGSQDVIENGHNGLLFDTFDEKQLVSHLRTLVAEPELRKRLGRAAAETVRREYTIEIAAQRYCQLYAKLVNSKKSCT